MRPHFYKGKCVAPSRTKLYRMDGFHNWKINLFPRPAGYERHGPQLNPWNAETGWYDSVGGVVAQALAMVRARLREQLGPDAVFEVDYDFDPRANFTSIMKVYVADKTHMVMLKMASEVLYPEGAQV